MKQSLILKIAAGILFVAAICVAVCSIVAIIFLVESGCYELSALPQNSIIDIYDNTELFLFKYRYQFIFTAIISVITTITSFSYLMYAVGNRKNSGKIEFRWIDKIPFDLLTTAFVFLIHGLFSMFTNLYFTEYMDLIYKLIIFASATVVGLFYIMSFSVRAKAGKWWHNTIIYMVCKTFVNGIIWLVHSLPVIWKVMLGFILYLILSILFLNSTVKAGMILLVILNFSVFVLLGIVVIQFDTLKRATERLASGDLNSKVKTETLLWDFKRYGNNLNCVNLAVSKAVTEKLKSERFKTELITNVSHDIKTPLTSIINYVDLLKRENIENNKANEYIEVLERQSAKLKKLIEDLIEASKVTTGNITVNPIELDIVELLNQSAGEYSERFISANLDIIITSNIDKITVFADGRLMWRILDNIFSNICKYSQGGTRVYFDIQKINESVNITFRNISKEPLNISGDELMERFVRGDSARTTEGNGLGLSIAKSLTELQGGKLNISIDGDLFKVIIILCNLKE